MRHLTDDMREGALIHFTMAKRPNILFLLSDEHSYRFMGHLPEEEGSEPVETPNFDWLAENGVRFSDTYCQVALCTPSRLCLLTGLEARGCGAWGNESVLRPELPTLPGALSAAGYETCLVGKMHLGGRNQFAGFHHRPYGDLTGKTGHQWEPFANGTGHTMRSRTKDAGVTAIPESQLQEHIVAEEGLAFLREHEHLRPEVPWFLCLSFSRPHFPLTAPRRHLDRYWPDGASEPRIGPTGDAYDHPMSVGMRRGFRVDEIGPEEGKKARAAYFACVSFLDEIIGDLLARLQAAGLLENTIIIYTSDHGEMAGEHGVWWKNGWYEGCSRVPLIISTPEHRRVPSAERVVRTPVALIDLVPTIYSFAGISAPHRVDGADLSLAMNDQSAVAERPIVSDCLAPRWGAGTEYRMVRSGRYKYVRFRNAPSLMFDLESDPGEQHNLIDDSTPAVAEARRKLEEFAATTMDFEAAERERTDRDAGLGKEYRLELNGATGSGNLYFMPNGTIVSAEEMLYSPTVAVDQPDETLLGRS